LDYGVYLLTFFSGRVDIYTNGDFSKKIKASWQADMRQHIRPAQGDTTTLHNRKTAP
jgi:hypothetical protein